MFNFRRTLGACLAAALAVSGALVSAPAADAGRPAHSSSLVVRTDKGVVRGAVSYGVEGFLGIPYAAAPVGRLRWQPPQPAAKWKGVRSAASFGSQCPQGVGLDSEFGSTDENCLFVNVQRRVGTRSDAKLPVYVYIHGGGFVTGSGENLNKVVADTGVIGVSLNYRLGALGFLSVPGLTRAQGSSGNYGLLDQQAALQWVQRNIARFGGDPRRVTIGGESAGGFSVCYHMVSPGSRGTFSQAMVQSGGCPSRTQQEAETTGAAVAAAVGCADPATAVACLRRVPVSRLLTAPSAGASAVRGTRFLPVDPAAAVRSGRFAHVPTVVGSQRDEARSFYQDSIGWTEQQYVAWVRSTFPRDAAAVLAHYPWPATSNRTTAPYLMSAVATDSGVLGATLDATGRIRYPGLGGCGTRELRVEISRYSRTYAYEFAHRTGPGWTDVPGYQWGAGHATELNYLFPQHGITTESEYHNFGPAEFGLADQMVAYWGSFVRHGDPSTRDQPWWPHYKPVDLGLTLSLRAGADGPTRLTTDEQYSAEHQCGFWDSIASYRS
ncbi:carboxylesterase/lipase family protein [Nakamurella endophytica]|uniref:Carboxylic ester hydrolase n=1 Tax=Nakamurella endophytica TaxID=1748367 RepID=A0A917T6N8_9ACTN|nr:carboxylesterase family protein [Nakamurella endophytica]GGM11220.1 carboxylic ester hydrolase [Nakamurella endophytica]